MRKTNTAGGAPLFTRSGWYDPDPSGTWASDRRRRRAGGTAVSASPAAELIRISFGIIAMTWALNPPRQARFAPGIGFDQAIKRLEAAERIGHTAALWKPRQSNATAPFHQEMMCGIDVFYAPFGAPPRGICVLLDAIPLSKDDGGLALFPDMALARVAAWIKASAIAEQGEKQGRA